MNNKQDSRLMAGLMVLLAVVSLSVIFGAALMLAMTLGH